MTRTDAQHDAILIVAGGTGGHIAPAIAVGQAVVAAGGPAPVFLCGSREIERHPFEAAGITPRTLSCARVPALNAGLPGDAVRFAKSFAEARALVRETRPRAVLAMGGYCCVPALVAARLASVPFFLHDSNAIPGRATRLFATRARCVLLGQDQAAAHLARGSRTRVVGTPVRAELSAASRARALAHFGLADGVPTMLVLGGSQGARGLNEALLATLESLAKKNEGALQVIWCCGPGNLAALSARLGEPGHSGAVTVRLHGFLNEMDLAYAASDFVLSRAGASTLAEITALGLPSLLVPYPAAKDNHQHHNALALAECGAAVLLPESTLTGEHLADRIRSLASAPGHRRAMAEAARGCGHPRAAEDIASLLLELPAVSPSPAAVPIPKGRVTA